MAEIGNFTVGIAIEPICKIICYNTKCKFNLKTEEFVRMCNLKHVDLDGSGKCIRSENE